MTTANQALPLYEADQILSAPFAERVRLVCQTWASRANPNPKIVTALYRAKYSFVYIGGFAFFVSFNADYPDFFSPIEWAFTRGGAQTAS